MPDFLKEAAHVRPTQNQLDWFDTETYAFIHFSPNTYTGLEWGTGQEPESVFAPTKLDCDQWVEAIKAAGMRGMVLTAKHHDGFCLWPSAFTEHSVKSSPFRGDVVREAAEACRRGNLKFGFYLSPWDRNSPLYGTPAYNDYFCSQLTELLTEYGEIFYVWFDGACGEGPNGKRQEYDWERYFELVHRLQPHAVIFNGPDVRWCGNEAGKARCAEWAVVPAEVSPFARVQTGPGPLAGQGTCFAYISDDAIGSRERIAYSRGLAFLPAEIDMSIRKGWFWHEEEEPHSLERLFRTYLTSVGANACFNLNVPPTREGLLDRRDVARLKEYGDLLRREFGTPIPFSCERVAGSPDMQPAFRLHFAEPLAGVKYVVLAVDIAQGQRVEGFRITKNGELYASYEGTTIGHKRICALRDPFADRNPLEDDTEELISSLTVQITAARDSVVLKSIQVF